jgi:hypothetical protein
MPPWPAQRKGKGTSQVLITRGEGRGWHLSSAVGGGWASGTPPSAGSREPGVLLLQVDLKTSKKKAQRLSEIQLS